MYRFNFSHSLYTQTNCLLKTHYYLLSKEMGMIPPSNEAMERGTNLHKMVENFLKSEEVVAKNELDHDFFHTKVVPRLLTLDLSKIEEVEAVMTHPLTDTVQGKGIMDLLYDGRIFDWKFTSKPWDRRKLLAYTENQALLYLWLYSKNKSNPPKDLTYWIFPTVGDWQEFTIKWSMPDVLDQLQIYRMVCDELVECNRKMHFPPNPSYFNCKWCDFNDLCPVSCLPRLDLNLPGPRKFGKR